MVDAIHLQNSPARQTRSFRNAASVFELSNLRRIGGRLLFFRLGLRLSLQNIVALPTQILSLQLKQRLGGVTTNAKGPTKIQ